MGIIAAFKEIVADNRFWKDCARKAQAELLAAGKQIEKLQDDAINEGARVIDMLDAAHIDAEKMMRERDTALAELSQVRAELDEARKIAGNAGHKLALEEAERDHARQERDTAVKRAEALSEENARLKDAHHRVSNVLDEAKHEAGRPAQPLANYIKDQRALLGRAVVALQEARETAKCDCKVTCQVCDGQGSIRAAIDHDTCRSCNGTSKVNRWGVLPHTSCLVARIDTILADATATQAVDAWRAQQEERAELEAAAKDVRDVFSLGGPTWPGEGKVLRRLCVAIAKVDARRVGGQ